jgi:hypothetical protein
MSALIVLGRSNPHLLNQYKEWLYDLVGVSGQDSYYLLLNELWMYHFTWTVNNDGNRAADGRNLRHDFAGDQTYSDYDIDDSTMPDCTVLEMIIGLSYRIEDLTGREMIEWFWELIGNLGLNIFTDEAFYDVGGLSKVQFIVENMLRRCYKKNGVGGLFPLNYPQKDQRRIELYYQMCEYLSEKWQF